MCTKHSQFIIALIVVDHDVIRLYDLHGVLSAESRFMQVNLNMGVEVFQPLLGSNQFGYAHIPGTEQYLTLKIRVVDDIEINQADPANPRGRQVHRYWCAQPPSPDHQDTGALQLFLAVQPDFRQDKVSAVTLVFLFR